MVYDEINGYTLTFVNPFLNPKQERDHTFVDEFSCIGKHNLLVLGDRCSYCFIIESFKC